jgi:hypothetical protein
MDIDCNIDKLLNNTPVHVAKRKSCKQIDVLFSSEVYYEVENWSIDSGISLGCDGGGGLIWQGLW